MEGHQPQYYQQQQQQPKDPQDHQPSLLQVPQDMEQVYHNHKVVAFPPSRGRTSVKEMANQTSAQKPFEPRRPRSLSAGRQRHTTEHQDVVQSVYDRMGFDASAATSTEWTTQSETGVAATAPHFVSLRGNQNINNNNNIAASSNDDPRILSPPRLGEGMMTMDGAVSNYNNNTTSMTVTNTAATATTDNAVTSPELQTAGSFQDRYRHAVSRGRSGRLDAASPVGATNDEPPRARSLSRGRQRMNSLWPPPSSSSQQQADTIMQPSPAPTPAALSQPTYNATPQQQQHQPPSMTSPQPVISRLSPVPGIAPSSSFSRGGLSKASPRTNVPVMASSSPSPSYQNQKSLARSPSWASGSQQQPSQATAGSYTGEEKKEEQQAAAEATPLSLKDRLHVYQAAGGGSTKNKSRSVPRQTRNVDPSTYAAQFAVRQHPPKIDIYAEIKREQEQQQQGHVVATSHASESESAKPTEDLAPEPEAAPSASSLPFKSSNPYRSVSPQRKAVASSGNQNTATTNAYQQSRPSGKNTNLANSFLAAINTNANSNNRTQQPVPATSSYAPSYATKPPPPVAEINVTESHDTGAGNDGNSVTGLMSAMSNEEFSVPKKSWQEQQQHRRSSSINKIKPVSSFGYAPATTMGQTTGVTNNNKHPVSSAAAVPLTPEMERLIEERVQSRVADLELQIEDKLRVLVSQMEDKIMERLDTLEHKMTAAVTKKK